MVFSDLSFTDRMVLNRYKSDYENNERSIKDKEQSAENKISRYNREIRGAERSYSQASEEEGEARSNHQQASSQVNQQIGKIQHLKDNPRPDVHAQVKPKASAYQGAVTHKEQRVGSQAQLTRTRDKAQQKADEINSNYTRDKGTLESQISNLQSTLHQEAQAKISAMRQKVDS